MYYLSIKSHENGEKYKLQFSIAQGYVFIFSFHLSNCAQIFNLQSCKSGKALNALISEARIRRFLAFLHA